MEEWQLITDKSGDLLGKRGLWDKYPLVLSTADNTASARQRVWGETIFKDITKIMCIHLNKNNSKLAFLPWKWLRFSRSPQKRFYVSVFRHKCEKNLFSWKANGKVFRPSHINRKSSQKQHCIMSIFL